MSEHDNFEDELVSSNSQQRNWRGIFIAMLVIASVLALIVTSVVLLTPPDQGPKIKPGRLKLSQILSQQLTPHTFNGSWISGDEIMYRDEYNNIAVMSAMNLSTRIAMNNQTYRRFNAVRFTMSPDQQYILLVHNTQKLFRHSFLAQYTIFDIQAGCLEITCESAVGLNGRKNVGVKISVDRFRSNYAIGLTYLVFGSCL